MTRRMMFRALLGLPVMPHVMSRDDRARMPVAPMCPRCGLYLVWPLGMKPHDALLPVSCACGWSGQAPRTIPIPSTR